MRLPQHVEEQPKQIDQVARAVASIHDCVIPQIKLSPAERTSNILASFFGLPLEDSTIEPVTVHPPMQTKLETRTPVTILPPKVQRSVVSRSVPIAFAVQEEERKLPLHRLDSAPNPGTFSPPSDFVDPKDGHIWRAKYCVLNETFLYFYRNAIEGESTEAIQERSQQPNPLLEQHLEQDDLSKSPLTRKFVTAGNLNALNGNGASVNQDVIWEKRVTLDRVGAVRSAESEHGKFAFELLADDGDRLILRANDSDDLNEWLFQFHRALASFMKSFVDHAMGHYGITHVVDLHRISKIPQMPVLIPQSVNHVAFNSRFQKASFVDTWSHKHGRSNRRREKKPQEGSQEDDLGLDEAKLPDARAVTIEPPSNRASQGRVASIFQRQEIEQNKDGVSEPGTPKNHVPARSKAPYLPPHLRRQAEAMKNGVSAASLAEVVAIPPVPNDDSQVSEAANIFVRGGCSDPRAIPGSIVDAVYKRKKSSHVGKVRFAAHGSYGGGRSNTGDNEMSLRWEIGAVSECGVRDSNEDSFFVCSDARKAFGTMATYNELDEWGKHEPGIVGIFDGHCGNEAARFATERITEYFYDEWKQESDTRPIWVKQAIQNALGRVDKDFCKLCVEDGRNWDSGATAIVVAIVDEKLIVSSLGDCRAVVCRSAAPHSDRKVQDSLRADGWTQLEGEEDVHEQWIQATAGPHSSDNDYALRDCYWKEVAAVHTPSRPDEKRRIENANGWITVDQDVPYGQMQRMDFNDKDVLEILQRCFSDRYNQSQQFGAQQKKFNAAPKRIIMLERVCGDLAVTRAIGDRDYKAASNQPIREFDSSSEDALGWDCRLFLDFPHGHSRKFKGDLVSSAAETRVLRIAHGDLIDEFLVLASDGLWDVLDPDDAVRVTRGLLFGKKWSAEKAAERLAELAVHLGSSDNVTVIVIRFFRGTTQK